MAAESTFKIDLREERRLAGFLNNHYTQNLRNYQMERIIEKKLQFQGIDLILTHCKTGERYYVDEKAQLDYLNEDLPTFAFEVLYHKNRLVKQGWLFDGSKKTHFYALITGIYTDEEQNFMFCKITLVNREKLIWFLREKNVTEAILLDYHKKRTIEHGKIEVSKLDPKKEGYLYLSAANKAERPLNLILKLDWLRQNKIAKRLV